MLKKKQASGRPRMLTDRQRGALKELRGNDFTRIRDKAILLTLLNTGMRANELMSLSLGDIDWSDRALHIKEAKGRKARVANSDPQNPASGTEHYQNIAGTG